MYEAAELPKNGKRRGVSLLPRLSVVSIIIATRHSAPAFHAASPLARAAYTPEPLPAADASRLPSEERPASAAPSSYSSEGCGEAAVTPPGAYCSSSLSATCRSAAELCSSNNVAWKSSCSGGVSIHGIVGLERAVQRRVELLLLPSAQIDALILCWDVGRSLLRQQQQRGTAHVLDVEDAVAVDVAVEGVRPNRAAAA
eukprot:scaffold11674_cov60-Phaeocystis_antarctica.AAC.2